MSHNKPAHVDGPDLGSLDRMIWLGDIPSKGADRYPERTALIFAEGNQQCSYAQLEARSNSFAQMLKSRGIEPGERVAYLGKNNDLYYPTLFGAIRAQVVLVAINWRLAAPEIRFQVEDSDSRLLICDQEFVATAQHAMREMPSPPPILLTEGPDGLRERIARPAPPFSVPHELDQIGLQLYTSGTTGKPKGVLISHGALSIARHAELISPAFAHIESGCVTLSAMPNFHIGGMSWVSMGLVRMGTVVITADPSALNMLKLIRQYGAQHSWMVPTLIRSLVDALRADPEHVPRFTGMFYGAMPMDSDLLRESMQLFGCSFLQFFGMTEVGGAATALAPSDHDLTRPALLKSVGKPYPGTSVQIRAPDRRLLNCGEHGEIWLKSRTVMRGYWNLPATTAESLVDGWYASGDGGYLDEHGYLFLTDRIKDMIISGGENVYPVEVEQALRRHAAVAEVAVVGLPDRRWGERVVAVVELRAGSSADAQDLIRFAHEQIADYKCPKAIEFTAGLPRTASGKVQRGAVRQALLQSAPA